MGFYYLIQIKIDWLIDWLIGWLIDYCNSLYERLHSTHTNYLLIATITTYKSNFTVYYVGSTDITENNRL